jgi:hypothetical protein
MAKKIEVNLPKDTITSFRTGGDFETLDALLAAERSAAELNSTQMFYNDTLVTSDTWKTLDTLNEFRARESAGGKLHPLSMDQYTKAKLEGFVTDVGGAFEIKGDYPEFRPENTHPEFFGSKPNKFGTETNLSAIVRPENYKPDTTLPAGQLIRKGLYDENPYSWQNAEGWIQAGYDLQFLGNNGVKSFGGIYKKGSEKRLGFGLDPDDEIEELTSALFFDADGNDYRDRILRTSVVEEVSQVDTGSVSKVIANNNKKLSQFLTSEADEKDIGLEGFSNNGSVSAADKKIFSDALKQRADDARVHEAADVGEQIKAALKQNMIDFQADRDLAAEKKTVGLEGYSNDGTVSSTDQEIFDNAKKQRQQLIDDEKETISSGPISDGNISSADQKIFSDAKDKRQQLLDDEKDTVSSGPISDGNISSADQKIFSDAKKQIELEAYEAGQADLLAESLALTEANLKKAAEAEKAAIEAAEFEEFKQKIKDGLQKVEEAKVTAAEQGEKRTTLADDPNALGIINELEKERRGTGFGTSGDAEGQAAYAKAQNFGINKGGSNDIQKYLDDEQSGGGKLGNAGIGINPLVKVVKKQNKNTFREQMNEYNDNYKKFPEKKSVKKEEVIEKLPSFADTRDGSLTGKDPFRFTTLAYPESITTDPQYGHFILFYVNVQNKTKYSYKGYNNDGDEISVGDVYEKYVEDTSGGSQDHRTSPTKLGGTYIQSGAKEHFGLGDIEYQKQQHLSGKRGNHLRNNQVTLMKARKARAGIDSVIDLTTRITDSVAIYLPSDINDNVKAGYQDFDTGFAGFVALSGGKILNQIADNDFEGAAKSFIGKGGDILKDLGKRALIGGYSGLLSGQGVEESFNKAFGQTVNPFIEVAFSSMGVRTFNYTFDFRPKSSRETREVQAIIQLFRFHMVPELKGSNHRYLTLPSTFDIHYMYQTNEASKENEFYSKIATCVLQGCDVNYTPGGVKSFESGAPTHITMALSFMETEMLTKEKINDGF